LEREGSSLSGHGAPVEHLIGVIKQVFGFVKVRYRGLAKNAHRLAT
jgi:hypothetical protein